MVSMTPKGPAPLRVRAGPRGVSGLLVVVLALEPALHARIGPVFVGVIRDAAAPRAAPGGRLFRELRKALEDFPHGLVGDGGGGRDGGALGEDGGEELDVGGAEVGRVGAHDAESPAPPFRAERGRSPPPAPSAVR